MKYIRFNILQGIALIENVEIRINKRIGISVGGNLGHNYNDLKTKEAIIEKLSKDRFVKVDSFFEKDNFIKAKKYGASKKWLQLSNLEVNHSV